MANLCNPHPSQRPFEGREPAKNFRDSGGSCRHGLGFRVWGLGHGSGFGFTVRAMHAASAFES